MLWISELIQTFLRYPLLDSLVKKGVSETCMRTGLDLQDKIAIYRPRSKIQKKMTKRKGPYFFNLVPYYLFNFTNTGGADCCQTSRQLLSKQSFVIANSLQRDTPFVIRSHYSTNMID